MKLHKISFHMFCSTLLLITFCWPSYSIDTNIVKFYPLVVGNSWTYIAGGYPYPPPYRFKEKVTGTIITNGHFYYVITIYRIGYVNSTEYRRIDSVKNCIFIYSTNGCPWLQNEKTGDSLSAKLGDSSKFTCMRYYRCNDTSSIVVFGLNKRKKGYVWSNYFEAGGTRTYAKEIGFTSSNDFGHTQTSFVTLIGCQISSIVYGDTSLTSINKISLEVPESFELFQNYPNPFNPTTIIKFDVPPSPQGEGGRGVRAIVYDVLGKEVAVLVSDKLSPGTYEVEFDGTNYPSGVYYYQLTVSGVQLRGSFIQTKKMILIR